MAASSAGARKLWGSLDPVPVVLSPGLGNQASSGKKKTDKDLNIEMNDEVSKESHGLDVEKKNSDKDLNVEMINKGVSKDSLEKNSGEKKSEEDLNVEMMNEEEPKDNHDEADGEARTNENLNIEMNEEVFKDRNVGGDVNEKSDKELNVEMKEEVSRNSHDEDGEVFEKALEEAKKLDCHENPHNQDPTHLDGALLEMFTAITSSRVPIRSQQQGEPEFSEEQKMSILLELYKSKPLIFLERFRKVLREEHLGCFSHLHGDYTADFYCKEIRKTSLKRVDHTRVRNKRYAALQQLITAGEYFSDEQMRERDPLMYEHYVGQYQSEEEIMSQNSKDLSQAASLSDVLLNSCQEQALQRRLDIQRELEDNCKEEDEDEEEESELQSDEERAVDSEEKALMREEFVSRMHQRFLDGKDHDFDYSEVDDNPDFDNLDIITHDEEERYFDDDDDDDDEEEEEEMEDKEIHTESREAEKGH
ncbi:coiled-coil domain-containing protein 97 isoform 2-T2 [Rhinophrynus dorsalis]